MKARYRVFIIITLIILSLIMVFSYIVQGKDSIDSVAIVVKLDDIEEQFSLFHQGSFYYGFLPSYANNKNTYIYAENGNRVFIDDEEQKPDNCLNKVSFNDEHSISIKNSLGITQCSQKIKIVKSENIPSLSLTIPNATINEIDNDKNLNVSGTSIIIKADGKTDYKGAFKTFHSRGNASWNSPKKPYTIEFNENVDLLNMGKGKKWVLLANSYDPSNMKNKIALEAAKDLGIRYCSDSEFVDLYVNSEYRGLYLLAEKIEINSGKVDISDLSTETQSVNYKNLSAYQSTNKNDNSGIPYLRYYDYPNNPEDITGGYILKTEMASRITEDSYFTLSEGSTFDVESPKYASEKQIVYISAVFKSIYDSLDNYEELSKIISIDSFVKRYLIQECFSNAEGSSFYFIKDSDKRDSKVYAEPIWDFDNSLGTGDTEYPTGMYSDTVLFSRLLKHNAANKKKLDFYTTKMKPIYIHTRERIMHYYDYISVSDKMNKIRWRGIFKEEDNLTESVKRLYSYLIQREVFLDDLWINKTDYVNIVFDDPNNVLDYYKTMSVLRGDKIHGVVTLEKSGYQFLGWFDSKTDERFEESVPMTENHVYFAKWKSINESSKSENKGIREWLYQIKKEITNDTDYYLAIALFLVFVIVILILVLKEIVSERRKRGE